MKRAKCKRPFPTGQRGGNVVVGNPLVGRALSPDLQRHFDAVIRRHRDVLQAMAAELDELPEERSTPAKNSGRQE